jgi:hypothetical protein
MSAYCNLMSIRKLFAILVAVAVLSAPGFATVGMAQAAVPDHHAQMMEKGHCDSAAGDEQDEPSGMSCCGAMCMAVAVAPSSSSTAKPLVGSVPVASLLAFRTGCPAELATPPPRVA